MNSFLHNLYTFLFALSIILINPWGFTKSEIWVQPKVIVVALIVILNFLVILRKKNTISASWNKWNKCLLLWLIYLILGLVSTLFSPFPWRSFWGASVTGDGLLYWILISAFMLSNALILQKYPALLWVQLRGFLIAGLVLAFSIFIQLFNWQIDFTITSGQVSSFRPQLLSSGIWQQEMPIGLYSNRGYTGFVLAGIGSIGLLGLLCGWLPSVIIGALLSVVIALFCTQTRAAMLAFVFAISYLFIRYRSRFSARRSIIFLFVGILLVSCLSLFGYGAYRVITTPPNLEVEKQYSPNQLEQFSTGRLHLWELAIQGIAERPMFGWGFNGFGISFPYTADWQGRHSSYLFDKAPVVQITEIKDFTFNYLSQDGEIHTGRLLNNKANNLLLDSALSTGILGLVCYIMLLSFCLWHLNKTPFWGFDVLVVVYLVFTFTWFESAQFSHLVWWILSIGLVSWETPDPGKAGNYLLHQVV